MESASIKRVSKAIRMLAYAALVISNKIKKSFRVRQWVNLESWESATCKGHEAGKDGADESPSGK